MLTLLLLLAVFTHSPLFMLLGLVLLAVVGWQLLKLICLAFLLFIASLLWIGETVNRITPKQWLIGSALFVVLSACGIIVAPAIALPTDLIVLGVFGLLVPFLASYSDAKGKIIARAPTDSTGSPASAGSPMLGLEWRS